MERSVQDLAVEVADLQASAEKILQYVQNKELLLKNKEERLRKGLLSPDAVKNLEVKMKKQLPSWLAPGNVGDLNQVIWPFMFVAQAASPMAPNSNIRTQFSNTQDSSFVCTHFVKTVYTYDTITNETVYIDPDDDGALGLAAGLQFSIRDAISQREFFGRPADLDEYGNPRFPTRLPAPQFVIPRGTWEVNFYNNNTTEYFIPSITFFGYKMRVENADAFLSTITG